MTATTSRRFGRVGFIVQTVDGTPETAPLFTAPIIGGGLKPMKESDDLPRIGNNLSRLGKFTTGAMGGGTVQMLCHPELVGLLLAQAMGEETYSGGIHEFRVTDDTPFPMTMWSSVGSITELGQTWRFTDAFINRLRFNGTSRQNIEVEIDVTSFSYTPLSTMPAVSGSGSSAEDDEPRFKYIGSNIQLSPDDSAMEDYKPESVMFEIDRAPEYRYGPSLTPVMRVPDRLINFDAGWVYNSAIGGWGFLMDMYTGSLTGTEPDQGQPDGQFSARFGRHPHDVSKYMQIDSNGQNWQYAIERPDAEAQPGILELQATGIVTAPDATKGGDGQDDEVIVTLVNDYVGTYA